MKQLPPRHSDPPLRFYQSMAFGSSRPARLLYQSRRMLKTSGKTNVNGGAIAIGPLE